MSLGLDYHRIYRLAQFLLCYSNIEQFGSLHKKTTGLISALQRTRVGHALVPSLKFLSMFRDLLIS